MTRTVRAYHALLAAMLPAGFNDAFAEELLAVYAEVDRAARARHGALGGWLALAAEFPGLARIAIRERRTHRTIRAPHATAHLEANMLDALWQDLSFAFRGLRRSPGFAFIAVATLALGIGANTAIFSVVNAVLLTPLKLDDPSRLVALGERGKNNPPNAIYSTSPANFYDWKSSSKTMHIAGFAGVTGVLTGLGDPQQLTGTSSIGGLLEVAGIRPFLGRLINENDESPAAPQVIVLSYDAWQRIFGDDRSAIGKTITLNNTPRTVVGVMPPGFSYPGAPNDFWVPSRYDAAFRANRDQYFIAVIGRLATGATIEQARSEMDVVADRLNRDWPKFNRGTRINILPLQETIVSGVRRQLFVLMGAVAFVLLITCANLANLLLARAGARRREIAVRQALGANRTRIVRQLLTESTVLALLGGVGGVIVGKSFLKLVLAAQVTTNLPRAEEITLDGRVMLFAAVASILAGLLFGSAPAWQLARSSDALRQGTRGSAGGQWMRNVLVVSELALAMILLTGAGLLLQSFSRLSRVDPGVRTEGRITFSLRLREPSPDFARTAIERISALPGVKTVAVASSLPITGRQNGAWFNRIDKPYPDDVVPSGEAYRVVTPEYFDAVGVPLRVGRLFTSADRVEAPAIVISEAMAKKYYPNENPIGKPVYLGAPDNRLFNSAPIVGVVGDTHDAGLGTDAIPMVYIPLAVMPKWPSLAFVIRANGNPSSVVSSARSIVRSLAPNAPIQNIRTLEDVVSAATAPARWSATLLGTFAAVAVVMAVLGVFGVLSFLVTQRTRELGIRLALGASTAAVQRLVVARGLFIVALGVGLGLAGAYGLTQFMKTLLYDVTPTDPATFAAVAIVLFAAAGLASYLPARRATRVDPMIALRAE
jgi:predicted permease